MLSVTVPNSRLEFGGVFSPSTDPPSAKPDGVPTTCKARSCSKTTPNPLHSTENSEEPKCLPGVHGIRRHGSSGGVDPAPGSELLVAWMVAGTTLGQKASELSKTTVFGLMLEQLQFPAPNRNPSQTDLNFEPQRHGDTEGEKFGSIVDSSLCLCASVVQVLRDNSSRFRI